MVESFGKGMIGAFFIRVGTLRAMKWPTTTRPLLIIPQMILGGVFMSLFDFMRRRSLQNIMRKEQIMDLNEVMRKSQLNYGSNSQ